MITHFQYHFMNFSIISGSTSILLITSYSTTSINHLKWRFSLNFIRTSQTGLVNLTYCTPSPLSIQTVNLCLTAHITNMPCTYVHMLPNDSCIVNLSSFNYKHLAFSLRVQISQIFPLFFKEAIWLVSHAVTDNRFTVPMYHSSSATNWHHRKKSVGLRNCVRKKSDCWEILQDFPRK